MITTCGKRRWHYFCVLIAPKMYTGMEYADPLPSLCWLPQPCVLHCLKTLMEGFQFFDRPHLRLLEVYHWLRGAESRSCIGNCQETPGQIVSFTKCQEEITNLLHLLKLLIYFPVKGWGTINGTYHFITTKIKLKTNHSSYKQQLGSRPSFAILDAEKSKMCLFLQLLGELTCI